MPVKENFSIRRDSRPVCRKVYTDTGIQEPDWTQMVDSRSNVLYKWDKRRKKDEVFPSKNRRG